MADIYEVRLTKTAQKNLTNIPSHCIIKLQGWIDSVQKFGLRQTRKCQGYHDEPLQGGLSLLRSVRLSVKYRAFYLIKKDGQIEFASIEKVNSHDYKVKK